MRPSKTGIAKGPQGAHFLSDLALHLKDKREDCFGPRFSRQRVLSALTVYSGAVDDAIASIARHAAAQNETMPCIVATGGYGRGELAPFSDIDLLFLTDGKIGAGAKKFIETVQQHLWSLGLKPSCSAHTLKECEEALNADLHFLTSLLERRRVFGPEAAFEKLDALLKTRAAPENASAFIKAKLDERDARHLKTGDTRFILQPNVKEGKGALRDIQTLQWILAFLGPHAPGLLDPAEAKTLEDAYAFFWTVRCHLHSVGGRADDRLSFDVQPEIARRMGYDSPEPNLRAESFMKDYFLMTSEVGHLTRILCAALEGEALKGTKKMSVTGESCGFPVRNNRLHAEKLSAPEDILRLFRASQQGGLDIHPETYRQIRTMKARLKDDGHAARLFLHILLDPKRCEQTLRRMNEAGILSALFPAFSAIEAHMQYDMYHSFTADEHTIRAVGMLHKIETGEAEDAPLANILFRQISGRRALYAAMFLHDIAKGTGGLHSEKGAGIARGLCPQLGLAPEETETVSWLVENHLLMTMTACKRDLSDPKTLDDFIRAVQSPERLRLLAILTTADIMAVGPGKWNSWKAGLLAELCRKAEGMMAGAPRAREGQDLFIAAQRKVRRLIGDKLKTFNALVDHAPFSFWLEFPPETAAAFVHAIDAAGKDTVVRLTQKDGHAEVLVHAPDRKGLFADIAGALAAGGASIADARIFTLSNGMALDVFHVETENAPYVEKTLKAALSGKLDIPAEIALKQKTRPKKSAPFHVAPRVIIDNTASASATVIEVNAKDRTGLLFDITSGLSREGLQISAAKIATFGARAVDVFYVKDSFGLKVMHNEKLKTIEQTLLKAIA